jgi:hypothetical protein
MTGHDDLQKILSSCSCRLQWRRGRLLVLDMTQTNFAGLCLSHAKSLEMQPDRLSGSAVRPTGTACHTYDKLKLQVDLV